MPCGAWWDGWIWPPGWLGGEVVAEVQRIVSHPGEPCARKCPAHDTGEVGQGHPAGSQGRQDWSRLGTGMAQCHQNCSPTSYALQLQTGQEELVPGAGRMLRSLDPSLPFPQQPASSSPALVDAASLRGLPKKARPDGLN